MKNLSYHEIRQQRKVHKAEETDEVDRHEAIINRLNKQLRGELMLTGVNQAQPTSEVPGRTFNEKVDEESQHNES